MDPFLIEIKKIVNHFKYIFEFKEYIFEVFFNKKNIYVGRRKGKTNYIRKKIKKYKKKYPNKIIIVIVPYISYVKQYIDLIEDNYLNYIVPECNIRNINDLNNILIFSDDVPLADVLLENINYDKYFVFGLY